MRPVVVHLHVLGDFGLEDGVGGHEVAVLDAGGVAEGEGPVAQGAAEGFPDAVFSGERGG